MLHHRIPLYYLFVTAIVVLALALLAMKQLPDLAGTPPPVAVPDNTPCSTTYRTVRLAGYNGIRPLIFSEPDRESPRFSDMKQEIAEVIGQFKASGVLTSASVHVRDFKKAEWTSYNESEPFDPGSLMKVPLLFTYLRMAEEDPDVLQRRYTLWSVDPRMPQPIFPPAQRINTGQAYTVEELLRYAITYSDNLAVMLLMSHVDVKAYQRTFLELGLAAPAMSDQRHPMTVREYSVFLKALFNSTYLGIHHSEEAVSLLLASSFHDGLQRGVPGSVAVAHKFGEYSDGTSMQLHESGIVYLANNPYVVTIMTKGPDMAKLPEVIGALSGVIYRRMAAL